MPRSPSAKAWALLTARERRMAVLLLVIVVISSVLAVAMVGAIYPFFAVVSNSAGILEDPRFADLWARLGIDTPERLILAAGAGTLLAIIVANLFALVKAYAMARYFAMRSYALSARMFKLQARQPYEVFLNTHPSDVVKHVINEPLDVVNNFMQPIGNAIAALVSIALMLAMLLFLNVWVTVIVFGLFTTSYVAIMMATKGALRRRGQVRSGANTARAKVLHELARCARDVRMTGQEQAFANRFDQHTNAFFQSEIAVNFWTQIPRYGMQMLFFGGVVFSGMAVVLLSNSPAEAQATLTAALPTTGVFVMAAQRMIPEIQSVYAAFGRIAYGRVSVETLWDDFARMEAEAIPETDAEPMEFHSLELDRVGLSYAGQTGRALRDVSLRLDRGDKLAIIGPSGSGKSSLIQVLMGLLAPQDGEVRVNGAPLTAERAASWRMSVAQVPQEVVVLSDSLLRNIALGVADEEIDRDRVWEVLRAVQLEDWAHGLEGGLDGEIATGAAPLSGGQKQRLGIARALYRDAEVVILDEATSALDATTQAAIVALMDRVFADKTVVTIAHRPEAIVNFPRRLILDSGTVQREDRLN